MSVLSDRKSINKLNNWGKRRILVVWEREGCGIDGKTREGCGIAGKTNWWKLQKMSVLSDRKSSIWLMGYVYLND